MRDLELKTELRDWFEERVNRYKWLTVKLDYSERLGVYLVSYAPVEEIEKNEYFIEETIAFEDELSLRYGDGAPLFCNEEEYFTLSSDAEKIKYRNYDFFAMDGATLMEKSCHQWSCEEMSQEVQAKIPVALLAA